MITKIKQIVNPGCGRGFMKTMKFFEILSLNSFAAFLARPRNASQRKTPRASAVAKPRLNQTGQLVPLSRSGVSPFTFGGFCTPLFAMGFKGKFLASRLGRDAYFVCPIAVRG